MEVIEIKVLENMRPYLTQSSVKTLSAAVVDICGGGGGGPIKISVHISETTPRKQDQAPYQAQTESAHLLAFSWENLEFKQRWMRRLDAFSSWKLIQLVNAFAKSLIFWYLNIAHVTPSVYFSCFWAFYYQPNKNVMSGHLKNSSQWPAWF